MKAAFSRASKVSSAFAAGSLCLFLGGCFGTPDRPFSLDAGDTPHLKTGTLSCTDPSGDDAAKAERKQFAELSYGTVDQYVLIGDADVSVQPFVFYQVKGDRYILVEATGGGGENLYIADVTNSSAAILDDSVEAEKDTVMSAAKKYGVNVEFNNQSWSISGPPDAQRKFMIDIAYGWPATKVVFKCVPAGD